MKIAPFMAKISPKVSESLSEYLILPRKVKCPPEKVSIKANLGEICLQYPFMTARMQSVVGPEMAVSAGKNGILTVVPRSLRNEDKQAILDANKKARLSKGDIEFQENPEFANQKDTLEEVINKVERVGHSVIPVMDRFSKLYGFYIHNPNNLPAAPPYTPISKVMIPFGKDKRGVLYTMNEDKKTIRSILAKEEKKFIPVVDKNMILQKLAFLQKFNTNYIGIAVTTRRGFEEEIEKFGPQVDTLMIDSSNAWFEDAKKILKYAKKKFPEKPFGIGNIVTREAFEMFAREGADYIIAGMGVGSICQTGSQRGNGRGQMTVARELEKARNNYHKRKGRYVPLVLDGGIRDVKDMTIALAFGDFVMMGNYFNCFYEAAGQKLNADKKPTYNESLIKYVESWGEGHPRARLVAMYGMNSKQVVSQGNPKDISGLNERYGHSSISSATVEGVFGPVEYKGRLKPCVENDARYIRTTISNSEAHDLSSFREKAVIEKASARTILDMLPHDVEATKG